jgi:hypothetical protein
MDELHDVFARPAFFEHAEPGVLFDYGPRPTVQAGGLEGFVSRLGVFAGKDLLADLAHIPELVIAGGSVVGALTATEASDFDLFVVGPPEAGHLALRRVLALVQTAHQRAGHRLVVTRSPKAVTIYRACGAGREAQICGPPVQVVLNTTASVQELLASFDVDCCCFAFSPSARRLFCNGRGHRALRAGVNHVDEAFAGPSYWRRLEKYGFRGWRVAGAPAAQHESQCVFVPELDAVLKLLPAVALTPGCDVQSATPVLGPARLQLRGARELPCIQPPSAGRRASLVEVRSDLMIIVWSEVGKEWEDAAGPSEAHATPVRTLLERGRSRGAWRHGSRIQFVYDIIEHSASLEDCVCVLDAAAAPEVTASDLEGNIARHLIFAPRAGVA